MKNIPIRESLSYGWKETTSNIGFWIILMLISFVLSAVFSLPMQIAGSTLIYTIFAILSFVVSIIVGIGVIKITLRAYDGKKPKLTELFYYSKYFTNYFLATILYNLIVAIGFILLIIPGIYWSIKYIYAPYLIVDKDLSITEAFKTSSQMTSKVKLQLILFYIVTAFVILLGFLAFGVGIIIAVPVIWLANAHVYRTLLKEVNK